MKCMAVDLTNRQWMFYILAGLLSAFFCIVNVVWFIVLGGGAGMLLSLVLCPLLLCYLSFSSAVQYRRASAADLSDGDVRAVCMRRLSGDVYAMEVAEPED